MVRSPAVPSASSWPTPPPVPSLRSRWLDLCAEASAPDDVAARTWSELREAYGSPARGYHTLEHIGEVLAWLDRLAPRRSRPLELAAWAHDVVYDVERTDNERSSAAWLRQRLGPHLGAPEVDRAALLVLATIDHRPDPGDVEATALVDADLAVLSAPPERYARYVLGVRFEYQSVDDAAWATGRGAVVRSLLGRRQLFHHDELRALEPRARENLRSELAQLDAATAHPPQSGGP